jgi:hypothetical protein
MLRVSTAVVGAAAAMVAIQVSPLSFCLCIGALAVLAVRVGESGRIVALLFVLGGYLLMLFKNR